MHRRLLAALMTLCLLLPASALAGAILLLLSDLLSRSLLTSGELPVGIVTATLGAPLFIYLLVRHHA